MGSYFKESIAQRGVGSTWESIIQSAAAAYSVPAVLIKGVISAESAWIPNATDRKGSWGLMQLNVAAQGITQAQAFDPAFAIPFGARVLAGQISRRSSMELALAGYNAGTSRSDPDLANRLASDVNGVATYVQTVLDYAAWFSSNDPGIVGTAPDGGLVAPPEGGGGGGEPTPPEASSSSADSWPFPSGDQVTAGEEWAGWLLAGLGILAAGWWVLRPARGR